MTNKAWLVLMVFVLLLALLWSSAVSHQSGESVLINTPATKDLYLAGGVIQVNATVDGDVVAAARQVTIDSPITGDVLAAGERVEISGRVADDVRAAGRRIELRGIVDGHMVAAGAEITLARDSQVADWVWLTGQRVELLGRVDGDARIAGSTVVIAGNVNGSVDIYAEQLRLEPGAQIVGDVVWRGHAEPDISGEAGIGGELIRQPIADELDGGSAIWRKLYMVLALTLLAIAIGLIFPALGQGIAQSTRQRPWLAFAVALLTLILAPLAIVLCFFTGVGFLVGLVLLMILVTALAAGTALGMLACARVGAELVGKPIASPGGLLAALVLLALMVWIITLVPVVGTLVMLTLCLLGIGTATMHIYRSRLQLPVN